MAEQRILDVWRGNRLIDFAKVKAAGCSEIVIRAGVGFNGDPYFARSWRRAREQGMRTHSYYVPCVEMDMSLQLEAYLAMLDGVGWSPSMRNTTPGQEDADLFIDWERYDALGVTARRTWILTWMRRLSDAVGFNASIYTAAWWWNPNVGNVTWAKLYPLWVANYTGAARPLMPWGWTTYTLWQFSETGVWPGVTSKVDLNRRPLQP